MSDNIILLTDSYKPTHGPQYPPRTQTIFSFYESRGGLFPETTFFGLQYLIKRYLLGQVVTEEKIEEAYEVLGSHFGNSNYMNRAGWEYILKAHGGRLPILIRAIPEGTSIPNHNVLMTVQNTDPNGLPWLTNYLETLLCQVWYPCTVATQSRAMRQEILRFLEETGDPSQIDFKLHDFGFRGSTSVESAGIGGAAHLVNFKGTDTLEAIMVARRYYGENMAGYSIPAAEHSTITSWGKEHEADAYANMLTAYPTGTVAVVSDSYDVFNACRSIWGGQLKERVLARDGVLVIRPDSGNPPEVVTQVLDILGQTFGFTTNDKQYRVLHPKVRVIQGDGIDYAMITQILTAMRQAGWSADNLAFGSGGGLLQKVNRDTQRFAFKCSAAQIDGTWRDVMKDPVTDPGKRSKAGHLALVRNSAGDWKTMRESDAEAMGFSNQLVPVFKDGALLVDYNFQSIRDRAAM
ncbi:MAG: nicotinate phosphoribosyltransferase [Patescibacteria group bacterium]|jgi:nicotinamide phosphoribosyltransferase